MSDLEAIVIDLCKSGLTPLNPDNLKKVKSSCKFELQLVKKNSN